MTIGEVEKMLDQIKSFLELYFNPVNAFSNIIDKGSLWVSIILAAIVSILFWVGINKPIYDFYENPPVLGLKHDLHTLHMLQESRLKNKAENKTTRPSFKPSPSPTPLIENTLDDNNSNNSNTDNSTPSPIPLEETPEEEYQEFNNTFVRNLYVIKKPLPLVGNFGWWFVSFSRATTLISVLSLSIIYVPITILVLLYIEPLGSYGVVFRRDYAPLLICTLMGWAATHLPISIIGLLLNSNNPETMFILWVVSKFLFGVLMAFALRVIFHISYTSAIATLSISWSSIILESTIFFVTSPFLLFWVYYYLRGDIGAVGMDVTNSFRQRQNFKRNLEACTINPQDAEAHYQLGLIHQQRRQYSDAIIRFKKAIEIDKRETDAHFQLGVIAREQNRLQEAISYFDAVVLQDEKHSNSEVWREIGATYEAAGMNEDASKALEKYVERRPYDAEGLYYYGKALSNLKQNDLAKEMLKRSIEAANTAPYHRKGYLKRWRKLSETLLKTLN